MRAGSCYNLYGRKTEEDLKRGDLTETMRTDSQAKQMYSHRAHSPQFRGDPKTLYTQYTHNRKEHTMDRESIRDHLQDYVESITERSKGRDMYICPLWEAEQDETRAELLA